MGDVIVTIAIVVVSSRSSSAAAVVVVLATVAVIGVLGEHGAGAVDSAHLERVAAVRNRRGRPEAGVVTERDIYLGADEVAVDTPLDLPGSSSTLSPLPS